MSADDTAILSDSKQELEELIKELMDKGREFGLKINLQRKYKEKWILLNTGL